MRLLALWLAVTSSLLESRLDPQSLRLVRLLVERGRVAVLPRVAEEFTRQLNAHRGIVTATVTSAVALTDNESAEIRSRVEAMAGSKVELKTQVDPALIGGLTIQVGDRLPVTAQDKIGEAYADAKAKAAVALTKDPKSSIARAVLARACRLTNELQRAEKALEDGLAAAPKDFDLLYEKGCLLQWKKDHEAAAAAFTQATEADPKSADAWYQKGFSLLFMKQYDDACRSFVRFCSTITATADSSAPSLCDMASSSPFVAKLLFRKNSAASPSGTATL